MINEKILAFGDKKSFTEWSKDARCIVTFKVLWDRVKNLGWGIEEALITPKEEQNQFKDLTGKRFGKLLVLNFTGRTNRFYLRIWNCICDCGKLKEATTQCLTGGSTASCGCSRRSKEKIEFARKLGQSHRLSYGESSKNQILSSYKDGAKKRNIEWKLTENEFFNLNKQNCFYCGIHPSQIITRKCSYGEYIYNGVDRIDSEKGYYVNNCVPCCAQCNRMKSNYTLENFLSKIKSIYNLHCKNDEIS